MLKEIYASYGRTPPRLLVLPVESSHYYHTDIAMLEYNSTSCIVQSDAFSARSLARLREVLGASNVHVVDKDPFCLNAVVEGGRLLTHKVTDEVRRTLERITRKRVEQMDTSITEQSGGSVRCMVLDIHPIAA